MACWSEPEIEAAARRLCDAGVFLGAEASPAPASVPADLVALLEHVAGCVRCRELLVLFQETERRTAEALSKMAEGADAPPPLAERPGEVLEIPLVPATEAWGEIAAGSEGIEEEPLPYALAADTPGCEREGEEEGPVLSLTSADGRYVVRIFPAASGAGATAVLLGPPEGEGPAAGRISLRVGDEEIPFGEDGTLRLPEFPASPLALVVR
jgi:hypothetical protein